MTDREQDASVEEIARKAAIEIIEHADGVRIDAPVEPIQTVIASAIRAALATAASSGEDTKRLETLVRLFTACPHTRLIVNDDADADEPVGWTLRTEGCETVEVTGTDLRDLLDKQERFDASPPTSQGGQPWCDDCEAYHTLDQRHPVCGPKCCQAPKRNCGPESGKA